MTTDFFNPFNNPFDPGPDTEGGKSAPVSDAEIDRVLGIDPAFSDTTGYRPGSDVKRDGWVHPSKLNARRRATRGPVDKFLPGRLRDSIAIRWPSPPENVLDARREALAKIADLDTAAGRMLTVGEDEELERGAHEGAVAKAYRDGKPLPPPPSTDWVAEATIRRLAYAEAVKVAKESVTSFGRARDAAAPAWKAALVGQVEEARAEAQRAMKDAAKAIRSWRAAVDGAATIAIDTGEWAPNWHRQASDTNVSMALGGLGKLVDLVGDPDPVVSGAYLYRDDPGALLQPPEWTREALARRAAKRPGGADSVVLSEIRKADAQGTIAPSVMGRELRY